MNNFQKTYHALNRKTGEAIVSYEVACARVMESLRGASPAPAGQIADVIWPNHHMTRQGAALAASRFADRMKNDGILMYVVREHSMGWVLTPNGTKLTGERNERSE